MRMKGKAAVLLIVSCLVFTRCGDRQRQEAQGLPEVPGQADILGRPEESGQAGAPGRPEESGQMEAPGRPEESGRADVSGLQTASCQAETPEPADTGFDFTICFAGDVNLDEN